MSDTSERIPPKGQVGSRARLIETKFGYNLEVQVRGQGGMKPNEALWIAWLDLGKKLHDEGFEPVAGLTGFLSEVE